MRNRASQQAGDALFPTSEMSKKSILVQIEINQPSDILGYLIAVRCFYQPLQTIVACIIT